MPHRITVACPVALAALAVLAALFGGPVLCGCSADEVAPRPNIVLLIVDDLGYGDAGFTGGDLETPHLDALARGALVLRRFYAAPMCSPSRAELLTGKHAAQLGMFRNVKPESDDGLPLGEVTLAERLASAGYRTVLSGKWHLGQARPEQLPNARGFEESYGHLGGWIDYETHELDGALDWQRDGAPVHEPGYSTDLIAADAVRAIEEHDGHRPLFLVVSFNAPHTPLQLPPDAPAASDARGLYGAMVERLDTRIGDIERALEARGMATDTLVWFHSDNGSNPKFGGSNAPLRGGKYSCEEGALRVPAWVRWPAALPTGSSTAVVAMVDLAPTLETLAGLPPRADVDGVDVYDALRTGRPTRPRDLTFAVDHARVQRRAVLRAPLKLIEERRGGTIVPRLYDVIADPLERRDLAPERNADVRELERALPSF